MPHEAHKLREGLRTYINRTNGDQFPNGVASMPYAVSMEELPKLLSESRSLLRNDDGKPWTPQNLDGSFPHLPGYDGPVEED
jgi:hypothetical protein